MPVRTLAFPGPLDLVATLSPLRHGPYDPTIRLTPGEAWRATRTPLGPATLRLAWDGRRLALEAWGAGAEWALAMAPDLVGASDRPQDLRPHHAVVARLAARHGGARLTRSRRVLEALVPAVLEQKVTGLEAQRVFRRLVRALGEPAPAAPGAPPGLWLPPSPERLAATPSYAYHPLGLERRRAELLRRLASRAAALERLLELPGEMARARLRAIPGLGPWSAAEVIRVAAGDPDAVSLGDAHLPVLVAWSLAGERVADDVRMLELLEPYRGQRARVVRLLELGGRMPARRAPRMAVRAIERI